MADDAGSGGSPTIRTGDIQNAEFTVNRYTTKDGDVVEEEVESDITDEDLAAISEEIETEVDEAVDDLESGRGPPEIVEERTQRSAFPSGLITEGEGGGGSGGESGTGNESLDNIAQEAQQREQAEKDPVQVGRDVAGERDITTTDFNTWAAGMRDRGVESQETISTVWKTLRDEDYIPSGSRDTDSNDESGAEEGGGEMELEVGQDLLLFRDGAEASERLLAELAGEMPENVAPVPVQSEFGLQLLDPLPASTTIPVHMVVGEDGLEMGSLEQLLEKYL